MYHHAVSRGAQQKTQPTRGQHKEKQKQKKKQKKNLIKKKASAVSPSLLLPKTHTHDVAASHP